MNSAEHLGKETAIDDTQCWTEEFHQLMNLPHPSAEQLRRMAELATGLWSHEESRPFWTAAAQAGDRDAADMLEIFDEPTPSAEDTTDTILQIRKMLQTLPWEARTGETPPPPQKRGS